MLQKKRCMYSYVYMCVLYFGFNKRKFSPPFVRVCSIQGLKTINNCFLFVLQLSLFFFFFFYFHATKLLLFCVHVFKKVFEVFFSFLFYFIFFFFFIGFFQKSRLLNGKYIHTHTHTQFQGHLCTNGSYKIFALNEYEPTNKRTNERILKFKIQKIFKH